MRKNVLARPVVQATATEHVMGIRRGDEGIIIVVAIIIIVANVFGHVGIMPCGPFDEGRRAR